MEENNAGAPQQYSRELKIACMRELDAGKSLAEIARQYQLSPKRLERWKSEWRAKGGLAFPGKGARPQARLDAERIALRWPAYGYCRVHAELVRQGWKLNHKRVLRLMRIDNLLCVRQRKFIFTTTSQHGLPIYPNLVAGLVVNSINQLWIADITYIRLQL